MRFSPEPAFDAPLLLPYLQDRAAYDAAADLIDRYGDDAAFEAAARAEYSRNQGNALQFCNWRQIERLIVLLGTDTAFGVLH